MNEKIRKNIDDIVWYIPFKKLRNLLREFFIEYFNNLDSMQKKLDNIEKNKEEDIKKYLYDKGYNRIVPIGHYESPYPPQDELNDGFKKIENNTSFMYNINAINMNDDVQLEFYNKIRKFFDKFDFPKEKNDKYRYYYNNGWYGINCASFLYSIINYIKPNNIIEIGSGFSTALMLDINNNIFNNEINILSIEPRPDRLKSLLFETDNISIIEKNQQDVDLEVFSKLEENDLLFIDSSHVCRPFGDINRQFFDILPNLNKGVIIHIHDIPYPFEYPSIWIDKERRAYTEAYMLRSFLQYNDNFEILCFPDYLCKKYPEIVKYRSGSIYLRKIK